MQGAVERVQGTWKDMLRSHMIHTATRDWTIHLAKIVKNYNTRKHSTTQSTPDDAYRTGVVVARPVLVVRPPPVFQIGTTVRIRMKSLQQFKKATLTKPETKWSEELFTIVNIWKTTVPRYIVTLLNRFQVMNYKRFEVFVFVVIVETQKISFRLIKNNVWICGFC